MKLRLAFVLALLVCFALVTQAQKTNQGTSYGTALGVKLYPGAISAKHFVQKGKAWEGLGYFSEDGIRLTGLYELHFPFNQVEGLQWYIGGGGHLGLWSQGWKRRNPDRAGGIYLGLDGVLGLDYKIKGAPLNISFDWQPAFNLINPVLFESDLGGLAIRYTF